MKKFIITTCGAIVISLFLISSATAVPKTNSDPLMDIVNEVEKNKKIIEENIPNQIFNSKTGESINILIKKIKDAIYNYTPTLGLGDLIDLLIQLIQWLISFLQKLINFFTLIFNLVDLIYTLVTLIIALYNIIIALIEFIQDLFNPDALIST